MVEIEKIVDKETIEQAFNEQKAIIFKDSIRCPISAAARKIFTDFAEKCEENIEFYMVDVIAKRELSEEIAKRTGVVHQSPQVILLEKGKVKWVVSHRDINQESLKAL